MAEKLWSYETPKLRREEGKWMPVEALELPELRMGRPLRSVQASLGEEEQVLSSLIPHSSHILPKSDPRRPLLFLVTDKYFIDCFPECCD